MPRRFFRKYLPSHAAISESRHIARFGSWLKPPNLWHLHRRSVAGGVAVGMFALIILITLGLYLTAMLEAVLKDPVAGKVIKISKGFGPAAAPHEFTS